MPDTGHEAIHHDSVLATHLIARGREMETLRAMLDAAHERRGRSVFLLGEPGIGKTRLAAAAATEAGQRGMTVMRGRAVPSASPVPFRPLSEALCAFVRTEGVPDAAELIPFQPALGRLVPEWRPADDPQIDDSVMMLAEAVLRFLRIAASAQGSLIVLEDLHWADPETLAVVEYLSDNVVAERVCCLGTLRDDEAFAAIDLVRALAGRRVATALELSRLDHAEVAEMVASCLNVCTVPTNVLDLATRAEGVPFLVEELLASTVASGGLVSENGRWVVAPSVEPVVPITFADSVRRRVDLLGADARTVLLAAAALGRRFEWTLLPAITQRDQAAVLASLHAAVEAHLIAVDPQEGEFQFRHALTRDAVLRQLLRPERVLLSQRALHVIEDVYPGLPGEWCELAADLAYAADDPERAAALLLQVGCRALDNGALASAESALERARVATADATLRWDIDEYLTEVLSLAGKRDKVFEAGEALLASLTDGAEGKTRRAQTYVRLARAAVAATDWSKARECLDRARALAQDVSDVQLIGGVDALAAQAAMGAQEGGQALTLAHAALEHAERFGPPEVACEALEVLGRCERVHDLDAAGAHFASAYAIAEQHGLAVWRMRALHELGTIELLTHAGTARLDEARALAVSVGAHATLAVLDVQIAASLTVHDAEDTLIEVARRSADIARRYHLEQPLAAALAFESHAYARTSRADEMERCLAECALHAGGDPSVVMIATFGRVLYALVEENRGAAAELLDQMAALARGSVGDQATGPYSGVWALVRVLDTTETPAARQVLDDAGDSVHFLARAYLLHAEAVFQGRRGHAEHAHRLASSADEQLAEFPWFRQLARRLVGEAAVADGWGDPIPWLREAMAYFEARGSDRVAAACRSLLRKAGAPVPRRTAGANEVPVALRGMNVTARELEVLRLLAEGRSNREIAERLYMSHRTVERHVANLTVKTGVTGRTGLVAFAARAITELSAP
jgi:DNA-binding CsgD family transcriptional regulator